MRVAIPHGLGREEVRRRMHARVGELAGFIPGGMARGARIRVVNDTPSPVTILGLFPEVEIHEG